MKILNEAYENYLTHMKGRTFPACYDSKVQFESWYDAEKDAHTKPRLFPCRDCTRDFQVNMTHLGRCANGKLPGVVRIMGKG